MPSRELRSLPPSPLLSPPHVHRQSHNLLPPLAGGIAAAASLLILFTCCFRKISLKRTVPSSDSESKPPHRFSYTSLRRATSKFSPSLRLGQGGFGSVYRGKFQVFDKVMAVKVLNLQQRGALKSFSDECRALKSIRHRNLLKIIAVCSSIDYQGNDFKCIVFEFMENGSLDDWLHSKGDEKYLNIIQRLNIAIDAASALDYLHNNCQVPIVHCDLKPSNILLDEEMTAHVGDFGLAKFLFKSSWNKHTSIALKGSIGYIPPGMSLIHVDFSCISISLIRGANM